MSAHAGRLRRRERYVFVLVFVVMAGFVGTVTVAAARSEGRLLAGPRVPATANAVPAGLAAPPAVVQAPAVKVPGRTPPAPPSHAAVPPAGPAGGGAGSKPLDQQLASALQPVLDRSQGRLGVGVLDVGTGATASFNGGMSFPAGGIATADILAAVLLQDQRGGTPVTDTVAQAAASMIEDGSTVAAAQLWRTAGGSAGLRAANASLKLRQTVPGPARAWARTTTTADDQIQLLSDLTMTGSPLDAGGRSYALGLMTDARAGQRRGAPAAASGGGQWAVTDGASFTEGRWAAASIGVVHRDGQTLLIAALSDRNPTRAAGAQAVQSAALAAAAVVTARCGATGSFAGLTGAACAL